MDTREGAFAVTDSDSAAHPIAEPKHTARPTENDVPLGEILPFRDSPEVLDEDVQVIPSRPSVLSPLASPERRWLGVCLAIAAATRMPVGFIRSLFAVMGVLTGPIGLLMYIALYAALYYLRQPPVTDRAGPRLTSTLAKTCVGIVLCHAALPGCYLLAKLAFTQFAHQELSLAVVTALEPFYLRALAAALIIIVPATTLGLLPLARHWDHTWRTLSRISVRVYMMAILAIFATGGVELAVKAVTTFVRL